MPRPEYADCGLMLKSQGLIVCNWYCLTRETAFNHFKTDVSEEVLSIQYIGYKSNRENSHPFAAQPRMATAVAEAIKG